MMTTNKIENLPDDIDTDEWYEFSAVQQATCLIVDDESLERFYVWRTTRSPTDAWS